MQTSCNQFVMRGQLYLLAILLLLSTALTVNTALSQEIERCGDPDDPCVVELSWDAPATRENGEPITADEIAGYRIYQAIDGPVSDNPEGDYIAVTDGTSRDITMDLEPRSEPYVVRFAARAVDTNGLRSDLSNVVEVRLSVPVADPGAPVLRITIRRASAG